MAVTAADVKRVHQLPDVPAIAETVPGYEANVVYGIAMPKGTPPDVVAKFNAAVIAVLGRLWGGPHVYSGCGTAVLGLIVALGF